MDKPIGWLRIVGRNVFFSVEEPVGKIGIRVPLAAYKEPNNFLGERNGSDTRSKSQEADTKAT